MSAQVKPKIQVSRPQNYVEPGPQRLGQQQPARLADQSGTVARHHDLGLPAGSLHLKSAPELGTDRTFSKPYPSSSGALFSCQQTARTSPL
jgi:hypothetical protein